jgi:hypothetical protein
LTKLERVIEEADKASNEINNLNESRSKNRSNRINELLFSTKKKLLPKNDVPKSYFDL